MLYVHMHNLVQLMAMQCTVSIPSPNLSMVVSAVGAPLNFSFPPKTRTSVSPDVRLVAVMEWCQRPLTDLGGDTWR